MVGDMQANPNSPVPLHAPQDIDDAAANAFFIAQSAEPCVNAGVAARRRLTQSARTFLQSLPRGNARQTQALLDDLARNVEAAGLMSAHILLRAVKLRFAAGDWEQTHSVAKKLVAATEHTRTGVLFAAVCRVDAINLAVEALASACVRAHFRTALSNIDDVVAKVDNFCLPAVANWIHIVKRALAAGNLRLATQASNEADAAVKRAREPLLFRALRAENHRVATARNAG